MELTYVPYTHPEPPVLEECWREEYPSYQMTMEERARFHGMNVDSYEQLVLSNEQFIPYATYA